MKVCAYHGNLYPHHAIQDFLDIGAAGFDTVLLCIPEQDMRHSMGSVGELRHLAGAVGLDVWAGPWGLGNIFGGEGVTTTPYRYQRQGALRLYSEWVAKVRDVGFSTVFLDEPRPFILYQYLADQAIEAGMNVTTSLLSDTFDTLSDEEVTELDCSSLGVSNYFPFPETSISDAWYTTRDRVDRLTSLRGDDQHLWVQGFGLGGNPSLPGVVARAARSMGEENFGFWSFRGCQALPSIAHSDPLDVWKRVPGWLA